MYGPKLVLHPRFDAGEILTSIQTHKATMFEGVPTMYMYMLVHPNSTGSISPRSRAARSAGKPCRSPRWRKSSAASAAR
jgi:acyl-CoA synthetase (AMP-forming)/AMP-acid ligase II